MWNVGVILEKENTDPQTYMNTHVPMRVFTLITRELKITFFCNFPSPFTYKIKKEMSWASNSVDCGSRFQCSSSRWVSGREVEMTQVWPKLWCNCLRLAVSQGLKNVIILPHHPTLDKVPHCWVMKRNGSLHAEIRGCCAITWGIPTRRIDLVIPLPTHLGWPFLQSLFFFFF